MDYLREYKRFISSHYLSDGIRITVGIVLPAIILNYFNLLAVGVVVKDAVSGANHGPRKHVVR